MSAQTVQSHQPSCFWRVQAVFDADGLGGDFAYTIGLHSVGLPELHLWARPTCGDDPAPDWKFSSRDLGALLNEFARLQLGGDLVVGSVVERSFDGGMARVRFEVDPPGDRAALEALGIARGASVLPIRWSLDRRREGEPLELDDEALQEATLEYAALVPRLAPVGIPPGWRIYARPTFTSGQRFGPLTALVHARAIAIAQAPPEKIVRFVELATCARSIGALGQALAMAFAVARESGRVAAVESVREDSSRLASWLVLEDRSPNWSPALERLSDDLDPEDASGRHAAAHALLDILILAVTATLATQVVADVAPEETVLMGLGPWLAAASDTGISPGSRWHAAPSVVAQVERIITDRADNAGVDLLECHDLALCTDPRDTSRSEAYGEIVARLLGMAVSSAALFPPVVVQVTGMPAHPEATYSAASAQAAVLGRRLTAWASLLTCALTYRAHLSQDDLFVFAEPYLEICPAVGLLLAAS